MSAETWHLAQLNVARARGPMDGPVMAEFADALDEINALAEKSEGFVWRYQDETGSATATRAFDDPDILLNLSVWTSVEALHSYVYRSDHTPFLRRRAEWFTSVEGLPTVVMWWIPAGTLPTIDESIERLERLRDHGPSADAFTFRGRFDPPGDLD